jgi:hypothetical protein
MALARALPERPKIPPELRVRVRLRANSSDSCYHKFRAIRRQVKEQSTMTNQEGAATHATKNCPLRERIGISLSAPDAPTLLDAIAEAEAAGVAQLWMTQGPVSPDSLTVYGAAFGRTSRVHLGTSIVPTYPRHPLALAQQAATVDALGPGRLRLGVGSSHRPVIEGAYGLRMESPMEHTNEYVGVLRAALWEGQVDHQGR